MKNSSENDRLTGHFQSCFYSELFPSPERKVKLVIKINKQSVLNLDRTITFNSVTLKNTQAESQKYIGFFFSTKQIIFTVGG